jgi:large subunit ribosomal protein L23
MALLDFLKKKEEIKKAQVKKPEKKTAKVSVVAEKKIEQPVQQKSVKSKKTTVFSYNVVKEPHISEKATMLSEGNQYTFKVYSDTNKIEIKKAIEGVYGVNVLSVNIVKIPKKKRRLGKVQGFKAGHTKAIVKIKEGQKIEIL